MSGAKPAQRFHVAHCARLTPTMRRITLACADCAGYLCGAMHLRLMVPTTDVATARYYTLRRVDPARGEVVIDALLHAPAGPGSTWAAQARPGDVVAAIGPLGRPVPETGRLVLVGDETALPVIARLIEEAAPERRIDALVEVAGPQEEQRVACGPNARLTFLHRSRAGASSLAAAVAALDWRDRDDLFVYAGVEAATADALRGLMAGPLALSPRQHRIVTYWRRTPGARAA